MPPRLSFARQVLRPIQCWPIVCTLLEWNEGWAVFPCVNGALLPPHFTGCACVCVCVRWIMEGNWRALCLLFNELGLYFGFLWRFALFIVPALPQLLSQCWLALEVRTPCHRYKRTQANSLCLPEILISECMLLLLVCVSWTITSQPRNSVFIRIV